MRQIIVKRARVSEHKARQAETVHKKAPDLEEKVISGDMKLKDAVRVATPLTVEITTTTREFKPCGHRPSDEKKREQLAMIPLYDRKKNGPVLALLETLNRVRVFDGYGNRITIELKPSSRPDRIIVCREP